LSALATGRVSRRTAYEEMAVAAVLWGTIGPAVAIVSEHTSLTPLQTSYWRLLVAIVPVTALALFLSRGRGRPTRAAVVGGLAVGVLTAASQLSYFAAVADSGIAIPTLIASGLGPILTAAGQTVIFKERPDVRTLLVMAVALSGLALLVLDGPAEVTGVGVLLSIASAVAYAAYVLAAGPVSRRMDVTALNTAAIAGGVLAMLPFVLLTGGPGLAGSAAGWGALLYLGLVVSGFSYALYFSAARSLPGTHITIMVLIEPVVAALIAVAFFDEGLTLGVVVGGLLMLGAVASLRAPEKLPA
jgi:drug/metabolite transporter, DME family